jgi:hypothetical protein
LKFFVGVYWKYKWVYDETSNGSVRPTQSGFITLTLTDTISINSPTYGKLKLFKTRYVQEGTTYPLQWNYFSYLAIKDGTFYFAHLQRGGGWNVSMLFSSKTGEFLGTRGFMGTFSSNRTENFSSGFITNPFNSTYSLNGVAVSESVNQPLCESVGGITICGTESYDIRIKEYYLNGIGFGGYFNFNSSVFTGGGIFSSFTSNMNVWLIETNIN